MRDSVVRGIDRVDPFKDFHHGLLAKVFVVGSIPPEQRAVWEQLEVATGVRPELYERGHLSGEEQGLDQCLQVHMLRAISCLC